MRAAVVLVLLTVAAGLVTPDQHRVSRQTANPPFQAPPFNITSKGRRRGRARDPEPDSLIGPSEGNPPGFLVDVEPEPGIHDNSQEVQPSPQPPSGQGGGGLTDDLPGRALLLLQRLNDRLTTLQSLEEQQLRRLETLEYRLTKMEVQSSEKSDGVKGVLGEVNRKVQELDWQLSKVDALLEAMRQDVTNIRQGQNEFRQLLGTSRLPGQDSVSSLAEAELLGKLQMIMASLYSVRGVVGVLQDDMNYIRRNLSDISNTTSLTYKLSGQLLTKQYFNNAMLDTKYETTSPVQAIAPHVHPLAMSNGPNGHADQTPLPQDCAEVKQSGWTKSGVYRILPPLASQPFFVYCEMDLHGGGWTVIHNRYEGTVDFYREWQDYKHGFGNLGGEFWLGLEKIHLLTNHKVNELTVVLQDFNLINVSAKYTAFAVGAEVEGYPISFLGSYDGDAGDSLIYHAGMKFSTRDMDQDNWPDGNCAESHLGAWWYNGCDTSNLNGRYLNGQLPPSYEYQGMYWYDWHGPNYSLMKARMMVRPRSRNGTVENSFSGSNPKGESKTAKDVKKEKDKKRKDGKKHDNELEEHPENELPPEDDYIDDLETRAYDSDPEAHGYDPEAYGYDPERHHYNPDTDRYEYI